MTSAVPQLESASSSVSTPLPNTHHTTLSFFVALSPIGSATLHFPRARVQGGTLSANCHSRKAVYLRAREENSEEGLREVCVQPRVGSRALPVLGSWRPGLTRSGHGRGDNGWARPDRRTLCKTQTLQLCIMLWPRSRNPWSFEVKVPWSSSSLSPVPTFWSTPI